MLPKTRSRRFIILANVLFLSLAANVFLAGWLVGGSFHRPPPGPMRFFNDFETHLKGRLSDRGQALLQAVIDELRTQYDRKRPSDDLRRENLAKLIAAPDFDPESLQSILQAAIDNRNELDTHSLQRIIMLLEQLDAEDRTAIGDFLRDGPGPRGPGPSFAVK